MLRQTLQALTLACGVAATLAMPAESRAACRLFDCLFGTAPAAPCATTYAPPYVPAPACQPCATVAPSCAPCGAPCAQPACEYMPVVAPTVAYRPYVAYAPVVTAAYQSVVESYAVTRYRPFLGTYETRLVPYTTYRAYYPAAVAYAPAVGYTAAYAYSPEITCGSCGCGSCGCGSCGSCGCGSCGSCGCGSCGSRGYSSCGSCGCGSCGYSSCGGCESGGCGSVIYGAPSGCSSCGEASSVVVPPAEAASKASPTPTFQQEKADKPIPDKGLEPIPAKDTGSSVRPSPTSPDPNTRTASRRLNSGGRVHFVAEPAKKPAPVEDDGQWYAP